MSAFRSQFVEYILENVGPLDQVRIEGIKHRTANSFCSHNEAS